MPAARTAVVALAVLLFAVTMIRLRRTADVPEPGATRPSPQAVATLTAAVETNAPRDAIPRDAAAPTPVSARHDTGATSAPTAARAIPSPFDFASLPRASVPAPPSPSDEERFPTTSWFTREDRDHPELYFELAARTPELNRPEERRATLAYFRAYREKLDRDLAAAGDDPAARRAIEATIARYDAAIARLGATIAASRD